MLPLLTMRNTLVMIVLLAAGCGSKPGDLTSPATPAQCPDLNGTWSEGKLRVSIQQTGCEKLKMTVNHEELLLTANGQTQTVEVLDLRTGKVARVLEVTTTRYDDRFEFTNSTDEIKGTLKIENGDLLVSESYPTVDPETQVKRIRNVSNKLKPVK